MVLEFTIKLLFSQDFGDRMASALDRRSRNPHRALQEVHVGAFLIRPFHRASKQHVKLIKTPIKKLQFSSRLERVV